MSFQRVFWNNVYRYINVNYIPVYIIRVSLTLTASNQFYLAAGWLGITWDIVGYYSRYSRPNMVQKAIMALTCPARYALADGLSGTLSSTPAVAASIAASILATSSANHMPVPCLLAITICAMSHRSQPSTLRFQAKRRRRGKWSNPRQNSIIACSLGRW